MASINYAVTDNWGSGLVASMTVAGGMQPLNGWTVGFDAPFNIINIWNAEIVSHVGTHYVVRNASYNGQVAAGQQVSFGFQADVGNGGIQATDFTVNGIAVGPGTILSVADATVSEGNSGTRDLAFTVTLSSAATSPVTVAYRTADGTATAGSDYTARSGTLTFAAGETLKVVHVAVLGDTAVEANETLSLILSSPGGATIARGTATGTISNDDAPPTLSIGNTSFVEGGAGASGHGSFTVTLSQASTSPVTVRFATANGTATAGSDYVAKSGTLTFAAGETTKTISVAAIGDSVAEANETFTVVLSNPSGATITRGTATGTITNDDGTLPTLSIRDATFAEGSAASPGRGAFVVKLSKPSTSPVTVTFATANGTATAGSDFAGKTGTLTFAAGERTKRIVVAAIGDSVTEADESFSVVLSNAVGATIADGTGAGTITNDDGTTPLPTLQIGNATFAEGSAAAAGHGTFTVTLSAPSSSAVTVSFATANGSAIAGSDYVARSGALTFAAGETSKTITVAAIGDSVVEANEGFTVVLSNAVGATIADGTGAGTITNDDVAPLPTLSIGDASVVEGNPVGGGDTTGWLSTSGNQIIDSAGQSVQIAGVNWFGFESSNLAPHGLWTRGYKDMMNQMVQLGFNTIRLPFSSDMLHTTAAPNGIDFSKNPDLQGLSALQIMDKIVDYAGQVGLKIILDHHRSDSGAGTSGNGLWYDSQHSQASWVSDWAMLATRYAAKPQVIGADLHNEPYNGTWGGGGPNDWAAAAERAGNAIGQVNPNWLIFVEGIGTYQGQSYWWGGNLMGVKDRPIQLDVANKLVYSAHDYPNSIYPQPWFQGADFPGNLPAKFDQMWGYIYKQNIAPVYIGEFGTKLTDPKDAPWLDAITSYLGGDLDNNGTIDIAAGKKGVSWTFWSWNPNSGDTGGILKDDWTSVNQNKLDYLKPIEFDIGDTSGGAAHADFVLTLSAPATGPVTVQFHTVAGDATSADFTATSGSVSFAAGERSKTISIPITADLVSEPNEHFTVVLTNASGATIARATATATIVDDDGGTNTVPAWSATATYTAGMTVAEDGVIYRANWWNQDTDPAQNSADGQPWTIVAAVDPAHAVPTVPGNLTANAVSATATVLSWHAAIVPGNAAPITGYAIFENGHQIAITTGTGYVVTNLTPDTNYQFTVAALDAAGSSAQAAPISVHTTAVDPAGDNQAHEFAPYIDMAMAQDADLVGISHASGIENFTLAFMLSSDRGIGWQGTGAITDDRLANGTTILQQVQAIQAQGGHITISFGGAAGREAALTAPNAGTLQAEYQSVIDRYHVDSIDFDIEGAAVADQHSITLRDQALVGLQAANPGLEVSFTLPVLPTGLDFNGLNLLRSAQHDGVRIDVVNIMAMDYGSAIDNNGQMGQNAIQAAVATEGQLQTLGLDARIGITPMIGVNDIASEVFTLADAQALVSFAQSDPNIVRLSMWSVARDNGATAGAHYASPDSSGVAQTTYEYAGILQHFGVTS